MTVDSSAEHDQWLTLDTLDTSITDESLGALSSRLNVPGLHDVDQLRLMSTNGPAGVLNEAPATTSTSTTTSSSTVNILSKTGSKRGGPAQQCQQQREDDESSAQDIVMMMTLSSPQSTHPVLTEAAERRYGNQGITTNNNTNGDMTLVNNNNKFSTLSDDINNNRRGEVTCTAESPLSTETQSPRIMIPLPVRLPPLVYDQDGHQRMDDEGEDADETVLRLATALVSISSSSELSSSSAPSAPSSCSTPTGDLEPKGADVGSSDDIKPDMAYAKLKGAEWSFMMRKPSLTMGRAPAQAKQFTQGDSCPVDFYLSSADSLSRTHLRIDYNPDRVRWEMSCLGKSGVRVDKRRYEAFCPPIPLYNESSVTVANSTFTFNLPVDVASRGGSPFFGKIHRKRKSGGAAGEPNDSSHLDDTLGAEGSKASKPDLDGDDDSDVGSDDNDNDSNSEEEYEDTSDLVGSGEYSKPPQSYANLIAEAINSTPNQRMTLSCIYQYLADRYPYFRHTKNGWQNSVRHNLSLNKAFKKVPRGAEDPGKGMMWVIDSDYKHLVDGSVGRRATLRARTPDFGTSRLGNSQRPPPPQLTFVHHQSMFQPPASFPRHHQGYAMSPQFVAMGPYPPPSHPPPHPHPHPHPQLQFIQQQQQQQQQQPFYYQQMRQPLILPAPDPSHLRPMAKIAAVISQSATAMSNPAPSNAAPSSSSASSA